MVTTTAFRRDGRYVSKDHRYVSRSHRYDRCDGSAFPDDSRAMFRYAGQAAVCQL